MKKCLREDLNGVGLAESYARLMRRRNYSAKELAAAFDVLAAVSKTLGVLKLPTDLRAKVADGSLAKITAYEISRLGTEEEQRAMIAQVLD